MTHETNEDVNKILEYLSRNDLDTSDASAKSGKMDIYGQDGLLSDSWQSYSEDLLENIFSLEEGSMTLLEQSLPDLGLPAPAEALSSSCSDSGLSSDQAEFDFEQQLSPFLIQNSCDSEVAPGPPSPEGPCAGPGGPASPEGPVVVQSLPPDDAFDMDDFERNVVPGFINTNSFPNDTDKGVRKRRLSQPPQPPPHAKLQRPTVTAAPHSAALQKPHLVVKATQRPVKVSNIQVINPRPKVYCKPLDNQTPQRKVIRVAPMSGGNPRSILLPVTIKDMKDLKSIKIINASDLKNASSIKLAAANLLSQSKLQDLKMESMEYEYENPDSNNGDDSGSDASDDDDVRDKDCKNGYPRLVLTAEERRLLAKEGISLPASYPLTKHEERELKRIRRKIRNKISAQDSRKRKKEYVDGLEDRVKQCTAENQTLIRRIKILQSQNHTLSQQLKRLQSVLKGAGGAGKSAQPATCLLVLLLSVALVAWPNLRDGPQRSDAPAALRRALLSASSKLSLEEAVIDDGEFHMDELLAPRAPRAPRDHDYPAAAPPRGYLDLPVDDAWPPRPPHARARLKTPHFDLEDGQDHLPPSIVKNENYESFYKLETTLEDAGGGFLLHTLGDKLGQLMDLAPVKSEDILVEEVNDYEIRNVTGIKSFVVNGTADH